MHLPLGKDSEPALEGFDERVRRRPLQRWNEGGWNMQGRRDRGKWNTTPPGARNA